MELTHDWCAKQHKWSRKKKYTMYKCVYTRENPSGFVFVCQIRIWFSKETSSQYPSLSFTISVLFVPLAHKIQIYYLSYRIICPGIFELTTHCSVETFDKVYVAYFGIFSLKFSPVGYMFTNNFHVKPNIFPSFHIF